MKIAILEDQTQHLNHLTTLLTEAAHLRQQSLVLETFDSGESFLFAVPDANFQLAFLDIQLAGVLDGMAVAKKLRAQGNPLPLAFVSNYDDYVFDGYDVGAVAYIMKPVTLEKILQVLDKIEAQQSPPVLLINVERETLKIPQFDILFLQVAGHTLFLQTQEKRYILTANLNQFEEELTADFLKINRGTIINLSQVAAFNGSDVTLSNGDKLPVSRTRKKLLKEMLLKHYRGLAND